MLLQKFLFAILSLLPFFFIHSQVPEVDVDVEKMRSLSDFGPNRKHFFIYEISRGFPLSFFTKEPDTFKINILPSGFWNINFTYKYGFTRQLNLLISPSYYIYKYHIKQTDGKKFIDDLRHSSEKTRITSLTLQVGLRINIGRMGDIIKGYVDLYGFAGPTLIKKGIVVNKISGNTNYSDEKKIYNNLNYYEKFIYGIGGRVGWKRIFLLFEYRYSRLLKNNIMAVFNNNNLNLTLPDFSPYYAGIGCFLPISIQQKQK